MNIKGSTLMSGFFLLIGLYGIITSANFHYWESITLPLITSSLVFILSGVQLVRDLRHRPAKEATEKNTNTADNDSRNKDEIKKGLVIFSWSAAFVLATYLFGFYLSIPVFSLAYLKSHSRGWLTSILFAVIITGFIYLVFNIVLKTTLYKGLIFNLF